MQNFMKTIINAVQAWTKKEISKIPAVEPDWNENDPSASSYIANRTHYSEVGKLISEFHFDSPQDQVWDCGHIEVEAGKTYMVVYNGIKYDIPCVEDLKLGDDCDESLPFYIANTDDGQGIISPNKDLLNLEIYEYVVKKLDAQYLPDNLATTDDVQGAIDLANKANTAASNAQSAADNKMSSANPHGVYRFSMNGTASGRLTSAFGEGVVAEYPRSFVEGRFNLKAPNGYFEMQSEDTAYKIVYSWQGVYYGSSYTFNEQSGRFAIVNGTLAKNDALLTIPKGSYITECGNLYKLFYYGENSEVKHDSSGIVFSNVTIKTRQGFANTETYAHIVGNGTSDTKRSNAHTLDWDGNAWYQGDVYVGSTSGTNRDEGSKKLATEEYVDNAISDIQGNANVDLTNYATKEYVDSVSVSFATEQNLTEEQKKIARKNICSYDWKTFRDEWGKHVYATNHKQSSLKYEIAQTIVNVTGNGSVSAIEAIVSWAEGLEIYTQNPSEDCLEQVQMIIKNYKALDNGGAVNGSLLFYTPKSLDLVDPNAVYTTVGVFKSPIQSAYYYYSSHWIMCECDDIIAKYYYDEETDSMLHVDFSYKCVDKKLEKLGCAADAKVVGEALTAKITTPATAQVGQTIVVKSVDENGKPTEWETVDPLVLTDESTGKKYKLSVADSKLIMNEVAST